MKPSIIKNTMQPEKSKQPSIIAHRGGSMLAPENTLAAFKNSLQSGVDWIELDVQQTKDKITVVIHDDTLNRTTTGKGAVNNLAFEKLRTFDAGTKFSKEFIGEKVPSLDETLDLINGKCNMLIEIKNPDDSGEIEQDVVHLINNHNAQDWCVVQSFRFASVHKIHLLDPNIKTSLLFVKANAERIKNNPEMKFISGINIHHRFATKKTIEKLHSIDKSVFVWTVNHPAHIHKMIQNGADGIITDDPLMMMHIQSR